MNAQVYLLAAGRGKRAGGPKAWRVFQNHTLLEHQIQFLLRRFRPENVAVSVQSNWIDRCRTLHADVRWVFVDPDVPTMGALIALANAAPLRGWGFAYHVDMPVWEDALFDALLARIPEATENKADAIVPTHAGRGGHPVLLAPSTSDSLRSLDAQRDRLDHWLRARKTLRVDVPFACIHENWNVETPGEAD